MPASIPWQARQFRSLLLPRGLADPEDRRGLVPALPARAARQDFVPALTEFFGTNAGLQAPAITWLAAFWPAEHRRSWPGPHRTRLRLRAVDGTHFNVRLREDGRPCMLVMVVVAPTGPRNSWRRSRSCLWLRGAGTDVARTLLVTAGDDLAAPRRRWSATSAPRRPTWCAYLRAREDGDHPMPQPLRREGGVHRDRGLTEGIRSIVSAKALNADHGRIPYGSCSSPE